MFLIYSNRLVVVHFILFLSQKYIYIFFRMLLIMRRPGKYQGIVAPERKDPWDSSTSEIKRLVRIFFFVSVIPQKFFHKAFIRKMNTRVKIVP